MGQQVIEKESEVHETRVAVAHRKTVVCIKSREAWENVRQTFD